MRAGAGCISGRLVGALAAAALFATPAQAQTASAELSGKFARGEYLAAAEAGETAGSADELAFAARALLAQCMTAGPTIDGALLDRAVADAETALRLDARHEEAQLQLAIAISLKSRNMDAMAAWTAGYGERGRNLAERVLKADPRNFYAHGFLAVWNLEVQRRGGGMGAWMMGASLDAARRHYETARGLAPDDVGIHWQYARALAALDLKANLGEVTAALRLAISAIATDHVEQVMQARAQQLVAALNGDRDAAQRLAASML